MVYHHASNSKVHSMSVLSIDLVLIDQQSVGKKSLNVSHAHCQCEMRKRDGIPFTGVSTNFWNRAT
jgi:hypothetical protein